jgi:hypothetical protein
MIKDIDFLISLKFFLLEAKSDYEKKLNKFINDNASAAVYFMKGKIEATEDLMICINQLIESKANAASRS